MPAKKDGQMQQCCSTPTDSDSLVKSSYVTGAEAADGASNGYSTCYNPGSCPSDRNGNPIYACFPSVGDQIVNCRSSCLIGHPQDFNRKLYDDTHAQLQYELPIAERGVELYENYGLTTDIRQDSARFGKDDRSTSRDQMTCAGELGRKVTLYGNVNFMINCNKGNYDGFKDVRTIGDDKPVSLGGADVIYTLTVWTDYEPTYNPMQRYRYFGNSGATFDYGGQKFIYIHGKMDNLPEVGYTLYEDHVDYFISAWQILKNYFGLTDGYIHPESMRMVNGNVQNAMNSPGTDSSCQDYWNFKTASSGAPVFPLPWTHSYFYNFDNPDRSAYNCPTPQHNYNNPTNPFNCYGTGIKSFYVPPHMEIVEIKYIPSPQSGGTSGITTTIRSEDSAYHNGTFPAYGKRNVTGGAVNSNRDSPVDITVGAISSVFVRVRQDDDFYNMYVKSADEKFAPEIFLIPGINIASSFASNLSATGVKSHLGNPLQKVYDPNEFWTSANRYWVEGQVVIDTGYTPGEVLYGAGDFPPSSGSYVSNVDVGSDGTLTCSKQGMVDKSLNKNFRPIDLSGMSMKERLSIVKKDLSRIPGTAKAAVSEIAARTKAVVRHTPISLVVDTSASAPTGSYRIKQFDVINGVYSIEWLYVLYYCAMKGRSVTYDPTTGLYSNSTCTPNSSNSCGMQCMLFRDDYTYFDKNAQVCAADYVMGNYCGMRNLSLAYSFWQQGTNLLKNDCSCLTQKTYCPAQFNNGCSTASTNTATYVSSDMADCTESSICSYCTVSVNQVINTLASCVDDSDNWLANFGDQCSNNTVNCTTIDEDGSDSDDGGGDGGGGGGGDDEPATDSGRNWALILLVLLIIIVVAVVAIYFAKQRLSVKN